MAAVGAVGEGTPAQAHSDIAPASASVDNSNFKRVKRHINAYRCPKIALEKRFILERRSRFTTARTEELADAV